jgi:hypothetical protein
MRVGSEGFYCFEDHAVPNVWDAAGACEFDIGEAGFLKGLGQGFARPEFEVAVIPEDGEVAVHFAGEGEEKIFQIAVIGGGEDDDAAGFEELVTVAEETAGVVDVFDDFGGEDYIDGAYGFEEVGVESLAVGEKEINIGERFAGDLDSGGGEVGAVELPVSILKEREEGAVAASGIHDYGAGRDVLEKTRDGGVEIAVAVFGVGGAVVVGDTTHIGYDTCLLTDDFHLLVCGC